jgi:phosphate-selective porin OprO/OprP
MPGAGLAQDAPEPSRDLISLRLGPTLRIALHPSLQLDAGSVPPDADDVVDGLDVERARTSLVGTFRRLEFQIEREFRETSAGWRDVFVDIEISRALRIRTGRFKMPFSPERMESGLDLDFLYRSLASTYLAPERDVGLMVHGLVGRHVRYQAGGFRHGGENTGSTPAPDRHIRSDRTWAGRVAVSPWAGTRAPRWLRDLVLSTAYTRGNVPEGLNAVRGDGVFGNRVLPHLQVRGRRTRLDAAVEWRGGPLSAAGEMIQTADQRLGQGTDDDNLVDYSASGWTAHGAWVLTGERKTDRVRPERPFLQGGLGALEGALRLEVFRADSADGGEPRSASPRARSVLQSAARVWTVGLNWYLNRYLKVQTNMIRERRDPDPSAPAGRTYARGWVMRVQVEL